MAPGRVTNRLSVVLLGLSLVLVGCGFRGDKIELDSLTLDVAARANDDTPIAVDFVVVLDSDLFKLLSEISSKQWFSERDQYHRDYRKLFLIWSLELVPGQFLDVQKFPFAGDKAAGLLVFAGYNTPGVHRLRLSESGHVWIRFDSRAMRLLADRYR